MYVGIKINTCKKISNYHCSLLVPALKKEDIQKIYEQKNYAYLRPEEMKHLRVAPKPKSQDTDSDTSTDSSE